VIHLAPITAALSPWQRSLLDWLGVDFSRSPEQSEAELLWTNLPASWGVFVLIALVAAVLYAVYSLYHRELDSCPPWAKAVLASLRAGVVLLLALILLGPAIVYLQHRTIQPTIVLARDASQSMNTADRYADESAAKIAAAALRQTESELQASRPPRVRIVNELLGVSGSKLLTELGQRGKLALFNFAEQMAKVETRPATPPATPAHAPSRHSDKDPGMAKGPGPRQSANSLR